MEGVLHAFCHSSTVSRAKSSEPRPRIIVNDAVMIHRLVANGAGIGCVSGYRELAPAVRAFVDFIKSASPPGVSWQDGD